MTSAFTSTLGAEALSQNKHLNVAVNRGITLRHDFSANCESRPPVQRPWLGETETDMWPYRDRTVALLRRYARASVEVGRLPSLLGRECFRAKVSSYPMSSFEDVVIFVHDMETVLQRLNPFQQRLIAMNVLEEYSLREVARLLPCPLRTVEREVPDALDELSRVLLRSGLIKQA